MKTSQYPFPTGRPVAMGTRCMIATPHYLASQVGLSMLEKGGSAVDALIAANAVLGVVFGHMSGLGGDLFAQVWDPQKKQLLGLNACGRSGSQVSVDFYKQKGLQSIPMRGPLSAITVPGVVDGWWQLHQRFGKLPWQDLFQPSIQFARGFPVSYKLNIAMAQYAGILRQFGEAGSNYLRHGYPYTPGSRLRLPDLARSLELVAQKGIETFYHGELAERIVRGLQDQGGLLTESDFTAHTSDWVEPLSTDYRGYQVTELPPNSVGITLLMLLNMLENEDVASLLGREEFYHLNTEAIKLIFADRDRWLTDPAFLKIPLSQLLSKQYARERFEQINPHQASINKQLQSGVTGGDTVFLTAVDENGLTVSLIQSNFLEFGSGFMPAGTGIILQNRGAFFSLDEKHVNVLAPAKRTMHTLMPGMVFKDGQPLIVFGTMGGEGQPQTHAALLTNLLDFGFNVQEAIEAPRWFFGRLPGEDHRILHLEGRIADPIPAELNKKGHEVIMMTDWSQIMGHAQAIVIDRENGVLHGGADPRGEGLALGY